MILQDLIEDRAMQLVQGDLSAPVTDLTDDARNVCPGSCFVARSGMRADGRAFIREAIQRGATAVITDRGPSAADLESSRNGWVVSWVCSPKRVDQQLAGQLAERFFGYPSRKLKLVGVTGTNGKTTTAFLIQHLLGQSGCRCGMIGTIFVDDGRQRTPAPLTTPGAVALSRHLATMVANGCQAVVAEVSSHALDQGRTSALGLDVGVFTNLSGDHLDYHGSMAHYAAAKAKLFEQLGPGAWAVVNANDPYARRMVRRCTASLMGCCVIQDDCPPQRSDIPIVCRGRALGWQHGRSRVRLEGPWGTVQAASPLIGRHNLSNLLQAAAAATHLVDLAPTLLGAVQNCPQVPGRLERIDPTDQAGRPAVLVDYAHTDDALEAALQAVRPTVKDQLWVVFGCGGDRDPTKRPRMAAVACRLADRIVITTDNPRTEDPCQIIQDILNGVRSQDRGRVMVEADRAAAINAAVARASGDDTVLLAGKGHEDYQIIGSDRHRFSDREQAQFALGHWGMSSVGSGPAHGHKDEAI